MSGPRTSSDPRTALYDLPESELLVWPPELAHSTRTAHRSIGARSHVEGAHLAASGTSPRSLIRLPMSLRPLAIAVGDRRSCRAAGLRDGRDRGATALGQPAADWLCAAAT